MPMMMPMAMPMTMPMAMPMTKSTTMITAMPMTILHTSLFGFGSQNPGLPGDYPFKHSQVSYLTLIPLPLFLLRQRDVMVSGCHDAMVTRCDDPMIPCDVLMIPCDDSMTRCSHVVTLASRHHLQTRKNDDTMSCFWASSCHQNLNPPQSSRHQVITTSCHLKDKRF